MDGGARRSAERMRWIALAAPVLLAACAEPGLLDPAGPVGAAERTMFWNAVVIMLAIIVPVIVLTLYFAWRYRADKPRGQYRPDFTYSGKLELLVWSIPALTVVFLGGIAWIGSHDLDPGRPLKSDRPTLRVQVIALDWRWLFIYPDQGVASINHLVMPVGTPVRFRITSATVMNSFQVPRLGSQIYAMAGMDAPLHLQADKVGRFNGLSVHYSGEGFSDMRFFADAVPADRFAAWVARTRAAGPVLDAATYRRLSREQTTSRPFTFRAVQPRLYEAALMEVGAPIREVAAEGKEDLPEEKAR